MSLIKKKRNELKYKKIFKLKLNIKNELKILKFRKKKWQSIIKILTRKLRSRPRTCKINDNMRYFLPTYTDYFKYNFRNSLLVKQKICLLYGIFLKKYLKNCIKATIKKAFWNRQFLNLQGFLIEQLENRLDTVLYRAFFVGSFRKGQQLIRHKQVLVNGKIVSWKKQRLKKGDVIGILGASHEYVTTNIIKAKIRPLPKYLQINYKTLQIMVVRDIKLTNAARNLSLWLDLDILAHYNKR